MRPFVSLSCSREDDRLVGKRLVRVLITPEENVSNILPELSLGRSHAPVGTLHGTQDKAVPMPRARRPRPRTCFAKDADASTSRERWNQRYCQDPECLREVRRWQAARRQAERRRGRRASKPSMPRPRKSAVSEPSPCPRPLRNPKLRRRVVTQQNFFSPSLMRSAGLLRTARDLTPQPGTLLLRRLPSGRSQRPGSGT